MVCDEMDVKCSPFPASRTHIVLWVLDSFAGFFFVCFIVIVLQLFWQTQFPQIRLKIAVLLKTSLLMEIYDEENRIKHSLEELCLKSHLASQYSMIVHLLLFHNFGSERLLVHLQLLLTLVDGRCQCLHSC